jgi:hypothetical protein
MRSWATRSTYDDLSRLDQLDWKAISAQLWSGDDSLREKKQAEFLVHERCPWSAIHKIGVLDDEVGRAARAVLADSPGGPPISVRPDWYYR